LNYLYVQPGLALSFKEFLFISRKE